MSLPAFDSSSFLFIGSSLSVALLGSWHCAGMCGPIAALSTKRKTIIFYQLGRLFSYTSLGALAGAFGAGILSFIPEDRKWIITVLLGILALWVLLANWSIDFPMTLQRLMWRHRPRGHEGVEFLSLGLLNGLLPCHWLYGFLMVAAGYGAGKGAILLSCLWAGSLPWLLGASSLSAIARRWSPTSRKWISRTLMVTVILGLVLQGFLGIDPHLGCKLSMF